MSSCISRTAVKVKEITMELLIDFLLMRFVLSGDGRKEKLTGGISDNFLIPNLTGALTPQPVLPHNPNFISPTWVFFFPLGWLFLSLIYRVYRYLVIFIRTHCRTHWIWAAAFWLPRTQGQSWIQSSSGLSCCKLPVRGLERGMLLHKCPLLTWEAVGTSHQAGGWKIRVSSKIWFLMKGEWCWWVVVQPWNGGDISMRAPQTPPERGRRLWAAHAAAAGGIHLLPILPTLQCSWLVRAQASNSEEEQRGNLPDFTE